MLRRIVAALCVCALGLSLGCGTGGSEKPNPSNLEYGKEGPPKRDGVQSGKKK